MNVGLMFSFRNPPKWKKPWADVYESQLEQVRLAEELGYDTVWLTEHHFAGDPTNWWAPSTGAVEAMIRTTGLRVVERPGHEIWVCERSRTTHHTDELDRATGRRRPG